MPIIETGPYTATYLLHDAPVNEKTRKVREMFKMDEETGYPEHYNYRPMARLGKSYNYEDPFLKFDVYDPEQNTVSKANLVLGTGVAAVALHMILNWTTNKSFLSRLPITLSSWASVSALGWWLMDRADQRQTLKNAMLVDYAKTHPERFGKIYRPKIREVLFQYQPRR